MKSLDFTKIKNSISHIRVRHVVSLLYFVVLFTAISFYMKNGYWTIGEDKYDVFKSISLLMQPLWTILRIIDFILKREWKRINHISEPVCFVGLYILAAIISTLTSPYRDRAIYGTAGWHMGIVTHIAIVVIYLMAYDLAKETDGSLFRALIYYFLIVVSVVFVIGIMNRYSIFPFTIPAKEEEFLSTIGNVNWFVAYWCIWAGIGCGLFMKAPNDSRLIAYALFVWISAMLGLSTGSDSAYPAWGIISLISFMIAISDVDMLRRWSLMEAIAALSLPLAGLLGKLRPYRMWYGSLLYRFTYKGDWKLIFIIIFVMCATITYFAPRICKHTATIRGVIVGGIVAAGAALGVVLFFNNSIPGGIWPVRGMTLFTLGDNWGNSRGLIWRAALMIIARTQPIMLVFGVGCDCFSAYAYTIEDVSILLQSRLGDSILTNAHNEFLTMVINEGLFGLFAYIGVFVTHIKSVHRQYLSNGYLLGGILAIATYIMVGMFGFMNILSTPFIFMVMGGMAGLTNREGLHTIN